MIYHKIMNKAEDYIEDNLHSVIRLNDIAQHVGLSDFHFHRLFKQHSNETIHSFVSRVKIERSSIFLKVRNDLTITEVAYLYGYSDSSSYIRAFKKYFGVSPSQFRNSKI
ncbi:helix-turn-helix transcriptional regulator [Haploplasma axanthum]|uniref:helix-turn-helix transcriptional regulator n=1 Tax=Haploplasma axanthum TaxID=29552 RepID=UPI0003FCB4A3|nr:AraC family transcriptional regulator [Haploplasma axanthum]